MSMYAAFIQPLEGAPLRFGTTASEQRNEQYIQNYCLLLCPQRAAKLVASELEVFLGDDLIDRQS